MENGRLPPVTFGSGLPTQLHVYALLLSVCVCLFVVCLFVCLLFVCFLIIRCWKTHCVTNVCCVIPL